MEATVIKSNVPNVVQNDIKQIALPKKPLSQVQVLANIERSRIEWQEGAYKTSNQQLYGVLAQCLAFGADLDTTASKDRNKALDDFYKERGYRIKKDTPLMTRIVRAVFGDIDRRRISTYSLVLRAAKAEKKSPLSLADWIEERGGVQEIRLARSPSFVSPKKKAELAQSSFEQLPMLATVNTEALALVTDTDKVGAECVLLATLMADGNYAIKAVLNKNAAVTAAFTALYALHSEQQRAEEKERKAANDADGAVQKAA